MIAIALYTAYIRGEAERLKPVSVVSVSESSLKQANPEDSALKFIIRTPPAGYKLHGIWRGTFERVADKSAVTGTLFHYGDWNTPKFIDVVLTTSTLASELELISMYKGFSKGRFETWNFFSAPGRKAISVAINMGVYVETEEAMPFAKLMTKAHRMYEAW